MSDEVTYSCRACGYTSASAADFALRESPTGPLCVSVVMCDKRARTATLFSDDEPAPQQEYPD